MKKIPTKLDRESNRFLHSQLKSILLTQIREQNWKPGDRLPSEEQLSKKYRINRATIRRALKDLIQDGLIYRVPATGTFVSDPKTMDPEFVRVGKGASNVAWLMKTQKGLVLGPFHTEMFDTANLELRKLRYRLVFFSVDDPANQGKVLQQINQKEFAAVVLVGGLPENFIEAVAKLEIPSILLDNHLRQTRMDSVLPDNQAGAYDAVRLLLDHGHRQIACIRAPLNEAASRERFQGYVHALMEAGLSYNPDLVAEGNFQVDGGERAMAQILDCKKADRPTAVFCLNDEMAIGAMKCIRQRKMEIPRDISVIGFDNVDWAAHSIPPLTTIEVPKSQLVRMAIKLLVQRMKASLDVPCKLLLPTSIVTRQSVAPCLTK